MNLNTVLKFRAELLSLYREKAADIRTHTHTHTHTHTDFTKDQEKLCPLPQMKPHRRVEAQYVCYLGDTL